MDYVGTPESLSFNTSIVAGMATKVMERASCVACGRWLGVVIDIRWMGVGRKHGIPSRTLRLETPVDHSVRCAH